MATKAPRRLRSSLRGRGDVDAHAVIVKKETERPVTPSCSSENDDGESKLSSSAPSPPIPDHVPSAPSRRLARDTSKDVLYAKGAAAQGMTNPGNRLFYRLCEDRYDEFAKLSPSDPNRKLLCGEIVDVIKATGGAFLKESGGIMKHGDVLNKVRDRLRQIGKPKLRPTGNFGPDDVVFSRGAANHLYPGNAKWRSLLDRYVISYYRHVVHPDGAVRDVPRSDLLPRPEIKRGHKGKFCKGNKGGIHNVRAGYQQDIIAETAQIIHDRGGKFRDERLNELCFGSIAEKTAGRFKDVKKELLSGNFKRSIDPTKMLGSNGENVDGEEGSADAVANAEEPVLTAAEIFHHRGGGFTSVKTIAAYKGPGIGYKPRKTKRRRSSTNSGAAKRAKRDNYYDSDDDDNSFKSEMLDSDSDLEISSDDEDGDSRDDDDSDNMPHKRIEKKRQAKEREQRLKRRKSRKVLHPQEQPRVKNHTRSMARKRSPSPKRKRKIIKQEEPSSSEEEDDTQQHPLSQYELYRLEKIKRNKAKLLELGLL